AGNPEWEGALDNFDLVTPDELHGAFIPDIASPAGQDWITRRIESRQSEVLILDSLRVLVKSGAENEAEAWIPVQEWLLKLRRAGITTMFLHHTNKGGDQSGTTNRLTVLDTSISLAHPSNYDAEEGLRAIVSFTKARTFFGSAARSFEVQLCDDKGALRWQ